MQHWREGGGRKEGGMDGGRGLGGRKGAREQGRGTFLQRRTWDQEGDYCNSSGMCDVSDNISS